MAKRKTTNFTDAQLAEGLINALHRYAERMNKLNAMHAKAVNEINNEYNRAVANLRAKQNEKESGSEKS